MYAVIFTPTAIDDLHAIADYIAFQCHSPMAALKVVDRIEQAVQRLQIFPESSPLVHAQALREKGIRFLVVGSYVVLYIVEDAVVRITNIFHGRSEWEAKIL